MPIDYGPSDVDVNAEVDAAALGQPGMTPPGKGQSNPGGSGACPLVARCSP